MANIDQVLELARRLSPSDRRRLVEQLGEASTAERTSGVSAGWESAIRRWLALGGTGYSEHTDVSANKYEHLARVYTSKA